MPAAISYRPRRLSRVTDRVMRLALWGLALAFIAVLAVFVGAILKQGWPVLNLGFLTRMPETLDAGGGIKPEIFNSLYLVALSLAISLPIGLGAGIYMAEYAGQGRILRFLRLCIETLAATPSIVLALFGMIVFVQMMGWSFSIRSGAVTLALLNIPVITRVTEVSLLAVPRELKEASYGLGATRLQTILKVALPYAATGILTGLVLTAGRAFGESAILVFTAGTNTSQTFPDFRLTVPGETLSVHLWYVTSDGTLPDAREIAAGTAAVMIVVLLVLNLSVRFLDRFIRRRTR
ncbi:phosphate transport system permease protein PstA [Geothrix rubra]|uniref:Phosphate transport system permease protein PstA n=1 Tax=Geothrix rubra TaxID=2927977 RepID=A0ABQ5Q333_9BACT|nr:phosphate ABC transporter permease PstA [Geothrix rubra]GLH69072.1 phosphate transport system permease protein PstA [Geothrix rubra]